MKLLQFTAVFYYTDLMRNITILQLFVFLIFSACSGSGAGTVGDEGEPRPYGGDCYTDCDYSSYQGFQSATGSVFVNSDSFINITSPAYESFTADAFFMLTGELFPEGSEDYQNYAQVIVSPTVEYSDFSTIYWLNGSFNKKIWLRFGKGTYYVDILKPDILEINSKGVIVSDHAYVLYRFVVENTNEEDGRYYYPSSNIQSEYPSIMSKAQEILSDYSNEYDRLKAAHDYTVKHLQYDEVYRSSGFDIDLRGPQDAAYAIDTGNVVCEGYASLYAALVRAMGYPAKLVIGDFEGGSHAWVDVGSYEEGAWKLVDPTADDELMIIHPETELTTDYPNGENLSWEYFWKNEFSDHEYLMDWNSRSMIQ